MLLVLSFIKKHPAELMIDDWWWLPCCLKPENVSSQSTGRDELASVRSLSHQFRYRSVWIIAAKVAPAVTSAGMLRSLGLVQQSPAIERNHQYNPGRIIMYYWITCAVSLQPTLNSSQLVHVGRRSSYHPLTPCSCTYFTHARTCDHVRVQSATQWTASVQTLDMPKPVITFVLRVLRNGLLPYRLYTCPSLW